MELAKERNEFSKNFIWNVLGTGFNSFNSLFFLIIVTRINGEELAGMFSIGTAIGLILYTIGLYSGRVCHVTNINSKLTDKDYVLNRCLTCLIMLILSVIIVSLRKYYGIKLGIVILLCIFKCIEAFCDIFYGIMQKNDYLYKVGQSLTLKSFFGLMVFFLVDYITQDLVFSLICLNIVNILIFLFWDMPIVKKIKKNTFWLEMSSKKNVLKILKSEFFVFANSFAGIYVLNASKYAIDLYSAQKIQAIFGYIMMPATIMILFAQVVLLPFLNKFRELYKNKQIKEFERIGIKIKVIVFLCGILAVVIAYFIGPEFLTFLYGINLLDYRLYLIIIIASYILYAISYINLVILTTMRKTFIQFGIYLISMLVAYTTSKLLVKNYEIFGAVLAIAITLTVQFVLYIIITKIVILKEQKKSYKN